MSYGIVPHRSPIVEFLKESTMRYEHHNLDGESKRTQVYDLPPVPLTDSTMPTYREYWPAVTDVPCPRQCGGTVRWAEAGYVPGYRICDGCGRHFLAGGTTSAPTLLRVGSRRTRILGATS